MPTNMTMQRTVLTVSGKDAETFLHRMLTHTVTTQTGSKGFYGCLLAPEGSLVAGGYWLQRDDIWFCFGLPEMMRGMQEGLSKYVFFRDEVTISLEGDAVLIVEPAEDGTFIDTGIGSIVRDWHSMKEVEPLDSLASAYDPYSITRRRNGVPVLGLEIQTGDLLLDWDAGFSLSHKGCYVGQEVVERMWSRARRGRQRVLVESSADLDLVLASCRTVSIDLRSPVQADDGTWVGLGLQKCTAAQTDATDSVLRVLTPSGPVESLRLPFKDWAENS